MDKALYLIFGVIIAIGVQACGHVRASSAPSAMLVTGPAGYSCFAIMNGDQAVGGNCVKE